MDPPLGIKLIRQWELQAGISGMSWSPDGAALAVNCTDGGIRLLRDSDGGSRFLRRERVGGYFEWSPDGTMLVAGHPSSMTLEVWHLPSLEHSTVRDFAPQPGAVRSISFDRTRPTLASGGIGRALALWDTRSWTKLSEQQVDWPIHRIRFSPSGELAVHSGTDIYLVKTSSGTPFHVSVGFGAVADGPMVWARSRPHLFYAGSDHSIVCQSLESETTNWSYRLQGHTGPIISLSVSARDRLLASKSLDESIRIWKYGSPVDGEPPACVAVLDQSADYTGTSLLAFNPVRNLFATFDAKARTLLLYQFDATQLELARPPVRIEQYVNARVVLVGDSGVGKSGLALALKGDSWMPTESTHGRRVYTLASEEADAGGGRRELRETMLWDLAGQPGYRVFHRQHLDDVAVALVVFDARSETEPFAGVAFWARSLDEGTRGFPPVKILVGARSDRGALKVSDERIGEIRARYGFAEYVSTSAKSGEGIEDLRGSLWKAIAWDKLPRVHSPALFHELKAFLTRQKEAGRTLERRTRLLEEARGTSAQQEVDEGAFNACLASLETAGLVKRLSFGDLVLLQPELLDDYAAWMAHAARQQADGLGFLPEDKARAGAFPMDADRRLRDAGAESELLAATIEGLVARGIALREPTPDGQMLIFPSEAKSERLDLPEHFARAVTFTFTGAVSSAYARMAVGLAHSGAFGKENFYRNAALFKNAAAERSGFELDYPDPIDDSVGRFTIFFDEGCSRATKLTFLRFVSRLLGRISFRGSVRRERVYCCVCEYNEPLPSKLVELARKKGKEALTCNYCSRAILLDDLAEQSEQSDAAVEALLDRSDEERARQARLAALVERERHGDFHVFLCHNSKDKPDVRRLDALLRDRGLLPWLDEHDLLAGAQFLPEIESALSRARTVAVVIGRNSLGPWQEQEFRLFFQRLVEERREPRRLRLIPVFLPGAPEVSEMPMTLRSLSAIDFRKSTKGIDDPDKLRLLVKAVLGEQLQ